MVVTIPFLTMNSQNNGAKSAVDKPFVARLSASALPDENAPLMKAGARRSAREIHARELTTFQLAEKAKNEAKKRREYAKVFGDETRAKVMTPTASPLETPQATPRRPRGSLGPPSLKSGLDVKSATPLRSTVPSKFRTDHLVSSSVSFDAEDAGMFLNDSDGGDDDEISPRASPPQPFSTSNQPTQRSMVSMGAPDITTEFRNTVVEESRFAELKSSRIAEARRDEAGLADARVDMAKRELVQIQAKNMLLRAEQEQLELKVRAYRDSHGSDSPSSTLGDHALANIQADRTLLTLKADDREKLEDLHQRTEELTLASIHKLKEAELKNNHLLEEAIRMEARIEQWSTIRSRESLRSSLSSDAQLLIRSLSLYQPDADDRMYLAECWVTWKRHIQFEKAKKQSQVISRDKMNKKVMWDLLMILRSSGKHTKSVHASFGRLIRNTLGKSVERTFSAIAKDFRLEKKNINLAEAFKEKLQNTMLPTMFSLFRTGVKMEIFSRKTGRTHILSSLRGWSARVQLGLMWDEIFSKIVDKKSKRIIQWAFSFYRKYTASMVKVNTMESKVLDGSLCKLLNDWRDSAIKAKSLALAVIKAKSLETATLEESIVAGIKTLTLKSPESPTQVDTAVDAPIATIATIATIVPTDTDENASRMECGMYATRVVREANRLMETQPTHLRYLYEECEIAHPDGNSELIDVIVHFVTALSCNTDTVMFSPRPAGFDFFLHPFEFNFLKPFITDKCTSWKYESGFDCAIVALILARLCCDIPLWSAPARGRGAVSPVSQPATPDSQSRQMVTPQATPQATHQTPQATHQMPQATHQTPQTFQTHQTAQASPSPAALRASTSANISVILDRYGVPVPDYN